MAGHNKWSKVKHKKGAADAKKSKVWTKIIREITVATKMGGEDPNGNPRLRKALDDARANNITKDTILRALERGAGKEGTADFEELTYEGYGPSGVAILVDCLTDNRNRTSGDVRSIFNKLGGNLGTTGSVRFGFKKKGQILFDKSDSKNKNLNEDQLLEIGLDKGLTDVSDEAEGFVVSCEPESLLELKEVFEKAGFVPVSAEVEMIPDVYVPLTGENAKTMMRLTEALEDLDDVQNVWSNEEIDED